MHQRVLRGRLTFWPRQDGQGYDFAGDTRFGGLFTGIVAERPAFVPAGTGGTEHITADDTRDADCGRLLERARQRLTAGSGKAVARPEGCNP